MTIGERVAQLRQERGWSQAELAQRAHTAQGLVSMIETGVRKCPNTVVLWKLAKAFGNGVTVEMLTGMSAVEYAEYTVQISEVAKAARIAAGQAA